MKKIAFILAVAFTLATSATAMADDPQTEFYDFENMHIDGEFVSPDLEHMEGQGEAQFDRLLNLQTSFIPKVEESTQEPALR